MEVEQPRWYRSPVDYEAWRKGYMPPSEHILIHKLSMGEVKVIGSSEWGDTGWWLVIKGGRPLRDSQRKAIRFLMETMDDADIEAIREERRTETAQHEPKAAEAEVNKTGA